MQRTPQRWGIKQEHHNAARKSGEGINPLAFTSLKELCKAEPQPSSLTAASVRPFWQVEGKKAAITKAQAQSSLKHIVF